jgi:hypothetical protein
VTAKQSPQDGVVLLHAISRTTRSLNKMQAAVEAAGFVTLTPAYASRHKALEPLAEDILGHVVMLGTPNGGSEMADRLKNFAPYRAFFGPAGQQLGTERDAATEAMLPPVAYPVGIIAGDRSIDPFASMFLPKPHDGRVSVANTKLDGMTDHVVVHSAHPFLVRNGDAIAQTIAFLKNGTFAR